MQFSPAPAFVYVTPKQRTRETAAIYYPGVPQVEVPDLREMDFGAFEGRSAKEMEGDAAFREWVDGGCLGQCPDGESITSFCDRVTRAFTSVILSASAGIPLVFFVHSGTIQALCACLGEPRIPYFQTKTAFGQRVNAVAEVWNTQNPVVLKDLVWEED